MTVRELLRAALSPRMLAMLVLLGMAAALCVRLGAWQFDRAAVRGAERIERQYEQRVAADPVPLETLLQPGEGFRNDLVASHASVVGEYEPERRTLVTGRHADGSAAALVLEPLRLTRGPHAGAVLAIARGWVPDGGAEQLAAAADDPALDPPAGEVTVTGHLGGSEPAETARDLPPDVVRAVSPAQLTGRWGGPGFSAYLAADAGTAGAAGPGPGAEAALGVLDRPAVAEDTGMNLRNLLYAAEWLIFAGFALALWVRMVRDQVVEQREEDLLLGTHAPVAESRPPAPSP